MTAETERCDCGSGLSAARCCAGTPCPAADLPDIDTRIRAARAAFDGGDLGGAGALCVDLLELIPDAAEALRLLARIRGAEGVAAAEEALLRRLCRLQPNDLPAQQALALHLLARGAAAEAEVHARNAVRLGPIDAQSHNLLAMALTENHRPADGEYHYHRVFALTRQRAPIIVANLAWNLKLQGRMDEARALYREALAAAPDLVPALVGQARLEEADRDFAAAARLLDRAEALDPGRADLRLDRAVLRGRMGDADGALALLDGLERHGDAPLGAEALSEKGRLLDRLGRFDEAFAAFAAGKALALAATGQAYRAEEAAQLAERLQGFFIKGRLNLLPRGTVRPDVPKPVFILGFPRSGTTLVEQSLSAHPLIMAGDELPCLQETAAVLPRLLNSPLGYPEALAELWMGDRREGLDELRDHYLGRVRRRGVSAPPGGWFTDKMPLNETHMGLIGLMLPQAPLIHVLRHPLDVVLSAFSNHLTHGYDCAAQLETIARHYGLVAGLIAHYRREMPDLRYMAIRYEDIVADQEQSIRRMLAFIGADFDPACLAFHANRRFARTASYAQVTEPLHDRSVGRWLRYRKHLEPAARILAPVIAALGYDAE